MGLARGAKVWPSTGDCVSHAGNRRRHQADVGDRRFAGLMRFVIECPQCCPVRRPDPHLQHVPRPVPRCGRLSDAAQFLFDDVLRQGRAVVIGIVGMHPKSMNTCSHRSRPRASSWPRKARHMRSHVPSSSHCRRRRQQVDPLGYPSGRSRQRAPVFNTQRIPSTTSRWLTRGRPPVRERRGRGRCGSILAHCASVTRTLGLGTSTSAHCGTAAIEKVQVLTAPFTRF